MSDRFIGEKIIDIKTQPLDCWVSYLGAVTTLLRSRGIRCDLTDVAGMSGYAFIINIHPELLPTGPVAFDWEVLIEGTQALGFQTELVAVERGEDDEEMFTELFLRVREEIDENRCCIVWGAGDGPEFNLITGYSDDCYVVLKRSGNWRIRYNRLKALWRIAGIFFEARLEANRRSETRKAILRAVKLLRGAVPCFDAEYHYGFQAFSAWAEAVARGEGDEYGFIYNLMCYYELQMFAGGFCVRVARENKSAAVLLKNAAHCFRGSFENLERIKALTDNLKEWNKSSARICELLRDCARLNEEAVKELERALTLM